ncbi:hypothetical protein L2E82_06332 [Cichorium intybus]|uniref:Uncharacterized protein n=1 Tax=Cichorium intybus TaxID=13427 RepID=A0ACB9HA77_CICIN|nr:hypothetical protein L2E82_06332 [Cichorium intybus]
MCRYHFIVYGLLTKINCSIYSCWCYAMRHICLIYASLNLRWKSLRMVSLMKRFRALVSPRAWFLNTTSSSFWKNLKLCSQYSNIQRNA